MEKVCKEHHNPFIPCWFLKIDTQGMEFNIVESAGHEITRCTYISTEVYCPGTQTYEHAVNDFRKNWLPYMASVVLPSPVLPL